MTFQLLTTIDSNFSQESLTLPIIGVGNRDRVCYRLNLLPNGTQITYGYFVIGNVLNYNDGSYESPERYKWYPSSSPRLFLFEIIGLQNIGITNQLRIFPIEQFTSKATPQDFSIEVSYFDESV